MKTTVMGYLVGGMFTAVIAAIPTLDAFSAGGLVLLASAVAGLGSRPLYRWLDRCKLCDACKGRDKKGRSRRTQPKRGTCRNVIASSATSWSTWFHFGVPCRLGE
jgi:hypothetical protein